MIRPHSAVGRRRAFGRFFGAVCCGLVLCYVLPAQVPIADATENVAATADPEPAVSLLQQFLPADIATAGYFELVQWLADEGLSTRGTKADLQRRLYEHFGITTPAETTSTDDRNAITIDSAVQTEYFTVEEIGESYIRLSGRVAITVVDRARGVTHRIDADSVLFNQTLGELTARGDIVYTTVDADGREVFAGDAVTFQLETWEATFVGGASQRDQDVDGTAVRFSFFGEYISRSADDVVVLDDAWVTSSTAVPPNYRIQAGRIWVLGPGEWGLQDAVLYVGTIPVLYLPFFFHPNDPLFFNPAVGTRDVDGVFFQTTTYLLGRRPETVGALSILQAASAASADREQELRGLFLRTTDTPLATPPNDDFVKLIFDTYGNLGSLVALHGRHAELGPFTDITWRFGVGVARNRYANRNGTPTLTTYWVDPEGNSVETWVQTGLLGLSVPFRYDMSLTGTFRTDALQLAVALPFVSDVFFERDYFDRAEDVDWAGFLGFGEQTSTTGGAARRTSFEQRLQLSWNPMVGELAPFINRIGVDRLVVSSLWSSKSTPSDRLRSTVVSAVDSPEQAFFFPDLFVIPDLSVGLSGTLLQLPFREPPQTGVEPTDAPDQPALRSPWFVPPEDPESAAADDSHAAANDAELWRMGRPPAALPIPPTNDPWGVRIGYSLGPSLRLQARTQSATWQVPSDVLLATSYWDFVGRGSAQISYNAQVLRNVFSLTGGFNASGQLQNLFDRNTEFDETQFHTLLLTAHRFTNFQMSNQVNVTIAPFGGIAAVAGTNVGYSLDSLLYRRVAGPDATWDLPAFVDEWIEWDDVFIRNHQVRGTLELRLPLGTQSVAVSANLPPRPERFDGRVQLAAGPVTTTAATAITFDDADEPTLLPITFTASLAVPQVLQWSNSFVYDPEVERPDSFASTLSAWLFQLGFTARHAQRYAFELQDLTWVSDGEPMFQPAAATVGLRWAEDFPAAWYNRVRLSTNLTTNLQLNFLRFTESILSFGLALQLNIVDQLQVALAFNSTNRNLYRYIPDYAAQVGLEPRSFVVDLLESFNIFDITNRQRSLFKMQSINLSVVRDLGDWDLTLTYAGMPALRTVDNLQRLEWQDSVSVFVQWNAISEIRSPATYSVEDGWSFE